jgi:hypothetical protein
VPGKVDNFLSLGLHCEREDDDTEEGKKCSIKEKNRERQKERKKI